MIFSLSVSEREIFGEMSVSLSRSLSLPLLMRAIERDRERERETERAIERETEGERGARLLGQAMLSGNETAMRQILSSFPSSRKRERESGWGERDRWRGTDSE
jgi:hypothetical protein